MIDRQWGRRVPPTLPQSGGQAWLRQPFEVIYLMEDGELIPGPAYAHDLVDSVLAPLTETLPEIKRLVAELAAPREAQEATA